MSRNHFRCRSCGWETWAPDHVAQVWHPCRPAKQRRRLVRIPEVRDTTPEENVRAVWEGFQSALPGEALLRPLDDVEVVDAARSLGFAEEE